MTESFSIKLGKFLYKHAFPVYNMVYPVFKRRQDAVEIKLITTFVKPGFTILDIGANIGFYTDILSKLTGPTGSVHAFEPETINFNYLHGNVGTTKNVTLVNKAVSDKTEPLKIYISKMLNVDHRTYPVDDYSEIIEINATTIDDYMQLSAIAKVDFIKMDIQGFEMTALKGMKKTLENNPDVKIITEFWPYGLGKAGHSALEVFDFLHILGFEIYLILNKELQPLNQKAVSELKNDELSYYNVLVSKEKLNSLPK